MTATSDLNHSLNVNELTGYLYAIGIRTARGKRFTADMLRRAVMYGWLIASKRGYDNEFTPGAIDAWIQAGCRYAVKRDKGEA